MKPKTKEEILKWMDKNISYADYYPSVEYEKRAKRILTENKGLNCSDRVR